MFKNAFDAPEIDISNTDLDVDTSGLDDATEKTGEDIANAVDMADDGFYHAERMSDEEVARIDDLWDETKDYSDVEPYKARSIDELSRVDDIALTDEEKFVAEIESMSLDDLQEERNRLEKIGSTSDMDIFAEYDAKANERKLDKFDSVIKGMTIEELTELRDRLERKDPETLAYLGIGDDGTDDSQILKLRRKL